jgi:hypothetical protein
MLATDDTLYWIEAATADALGNPIDNARIVRAAWPRAPEVVASGLKSVQRPTAWGEQLYFVQGEGLVRVALDADDQPPQLLYASGAASGPEFYPHSFGLSEAGIFVLSAQGIWKGALDGSTPLALLDGTEDVVANTGMVVDATHLYFGVRYLANPSGLDELATLIRQPIEDAGEREELGLLQQLEDELGFVRAGSPYILGEFDIRRAPLGQVDGERVTKNQSEGDFDWSLQGDALYWQSQRWPSEDQPSPEYTAVTTLGATLSVRYFEHFPSGEFAATQSHLFSATATAIYVRAIEDGTGNP